MESCIQCHRMYNFHCILYVSVCLENGFPTFPYKNIQENKADCCKKKKKKKKKKRSTEDHHLNKHSALMLSWFWRRFFNVYFIIQGHGGQLCQQIMTIWTNFQSPLSKKTAHEVWWKLSKSLNMWENDAGITDGISHNGSSWAFGSVKLKIWLRWTTQKNFMQGLFFDEIIRLFAHFLVRNLRTLLNRKNLISKCNLTKDFFKNFSLKIYFLPFFSPEFLKWSLLFLNVDTAIVANRGFSQKSITERQTV